MTLLYHNLIPPSTQYGIIFSFFITIPFTTFKASPYNRAKRKIYESSHYIRTDFLEQVVHGEIRRFTRFATKYENAFAKLVMGNSLKSAEQEMQFKESELKKLQARDKELVNELNLSKKIL